MHFSHNQGARVSRTHDHHSVGNPGRQGLNFCRARLALQQAQEHACGADGQEVEHPLKKQHRAGKDPRASCRRGQKTIDDRRGEQRADGNGLYDGDELRDARVAPPVTVEAKEVVDTRADEKKRVEQVGVVADVWPDMDRGFVANHKRRYGGQRDQAEVYRQ